MTAQVIQRDKLGVLTKIGQGGQGVVYGTPNVKTKFAASMVFKEYKPQTRADIDFTALAAMPVLVEDSLSYGQGERLISIAAWPCALVESDGVSTGFVMPAIPERFFIDLTTVKGVSSSTAEFQHLLNHPSVLAARDITIDDAQRYSLLREAASALAFLHRHSVCVGDISPKNLLFTLTPHEAVYFIDCDAMRINGVSALRQVETPGWQVPPGEELATIYSDTYKLGLLALRLLAGDHDTKNPAHLPPVMPDLLRQIITDTLTNQPHQRPLPEAWTYVLGHAIERAQYGKKAAAPAPGGAELDPPPIPVVHSRPSTPTAPAKPASPPKAAPAPPAAPPAAAQNAPAQPDARRPRTVTAAAVIAVLDAAVFAVFTLFFNYRLMVGVLAGLAAAALLIWGAIAAWRGVTRAVLFVAAPLSFAAGIVFRDFPPLISLVAALTVPLLLATGSSRVFFAARASQKRSPDPLAATAPSPDEPTAFLRSPVGIAMLIAVVGIAAAIGVNAVARQRHLQASQATGPTPVTSAALDGLLLTPSEIGTAMGATDMVASQPSTQAGWSEDPTASDKACQPLNHPGVTGDGAYVDSGWYTMRGQILQDPYANYAVSEAVVLFPSVDKAAAFAAASAQSWLACSNREYTTGGNTWVVGSIADTNGTLSATENQTGNASRQCQRALTVVKNVAIDIRACKDGVAGTAVDIAYQIAAKVPATQ
jgi:serine/threonine protein kinase